MSKFEQMTAFIDTVEESGFAAAGRKQGLSRASISRQISALEAALGVQLLHRTTRQITLTNTGREYYQQCKNALQALQEAENAIVESREEATGVLHIVGSRYFSGRHLLPRLPEFMAQNPKLQVYFELAERFPDLSKEGVDILFGVSIDGPSELVRKRVAGTRYILCASPAYLAEYGTPVMSMELTKHRYITHTMRKPADILTFKGKEVYVEPILWLNDSMAMCECALRGMGIIKVHDYLVADALQEGRLVEILPTCREPPISVYLYYQQSRYLQPKIRRFIDFYTVT